MEKGALIGAGRTADVYAWGEDRILKLFQDWMPEAAVKEEFNITRLVRETGLPVPSADELVEIDGRPGIIFERLYGPSMLRVIEKQPLKSISMARLLAELHARMHACPLPPNTPGQHQQLERGIGWAKDLTEAEKQTIRAILARRPDGNAVCHGDFHPDNVLITGHGPVIIDWMTGRSGHPLADLTRTSLLLTSGGLPPRMSLLTRRFINTMRHLIHSVYINRYLQMHPTPRSEIDAWQLPILAARLFEVENYPAEKEIILAHIRTALAKTEQ
jgi:uncharacterized protein (TIGR02172 family)